MKTTSYLRNWQLAVSAFIISALPNLSFSQGIGINNSAAGANASAMLDVSSTTMGMLVPRMTNAQKTAIASPATGLLVYQTDGTTGFWYYNGAAWAQVGGVGWGLTGNSGTTAGTNYCGTSDGVDFVLGTVGARRLTILGTGNVGYTGIGIAVPTEKLHVSGGNIQLDNTYGLNFAGSGGATQSQLYSIAASNRIYVKAENTTDVGEFASYGLYLPKTNAYNLYVGGGAQFAYGTAGYLDFKNEGGISTNSGTLNMYFKNSGNVGVGLNNPAYGLELNGTFGYGDGTAGSYRSRTETRADAGLQGSQSGFYQTSAPSPGANWHMIPAQTPSPSPYIDVNGNAINWWHLLDVRHSNNGNNYAMQIAGSFFDQDFYVRKTNNSATQKWAKLLTEDNSYGSNIQTVKLNADQSTNSTTYVDLPGMTLTFTPVHSTVLLFFSIHCDMSSTGMYKAWIRVYNNNTASSIAAVGGTVEDYDGDNEDGFGYSYFSTGQNYVISGYPVTVTPGTSYTFKVQWRRTAMWGTGSLRCAPLTTTDNIQQCIITVVD